MEIYPLQEFHFMDKKQLLLASGEKCRPLLAQKALNGYQTRKKECLSYTCV